MAKGVMFSLMFVFLTTLLIILSTLIFRTALSSEEYATEIALMNRLYDLDQSLQQITRQLLIANTFLFASQNRSATITQDLPFQNDAALNVSFTNLKNFIEPDDAAIRFSSASFNAKQFQINPYMINYSRPDNQSIRIIPTSLNYDQYTFAFFTTNQSAGKIVWNDFDAGTFPITIISGNATAQISSTQNVDLADDVDIRIQNIAAGEIRITIDDQKVDITSSMTVRVRANTTITFTNGKTKPIITFPDVYTITFPDFNVTKNSGVQLTTN